MPLVVGVDSSTQSTKAELRHLETGELIATGRGTHPPTSPPVSEQDPGAWWEALVEAITALGDRRDEVVAISVAGQQHGLVLLDSDGDVLRPAKLWNDTQSAPQAERLVAEIGADWWADWAGVVPVAAFTITKLAWVIENEPDLIARIDKLMLPHDWLTWKLTGAHVTDRGDASGSGWYDATHDLVLREPFARLGMDPEVWAAKAPRVLQPTDSAGVLLPEVAAELGLPSDVVVGPGTGDNMGAALGLGLAEGDAVISLGTSGTVYARTTERAHDTSGAVAGFCDATGGYLPLVCTLNATKVTDTVAAWLGTDAAGLSDLALQAGTDVIEATLIPWFDGERTPNRPDARGTIVGLNNAITREEIARVAHDGVLMGLLAGLRALEEAGSTVDGRLLLVGGGARSGAYRQRLADLTGRTVHVPVNDEAVAVGAALQAAATATDTSFDTLADRWGLQATTTTEPRDDTHADVLQSRYADAQQVDDGLCRPLTSSS
jgi:xylulokinase